MDKQQNNENVLALSQLLHTALNRRVYTSAVSFMMPFFLLHKSAHKHTQGRFALVNRFHEMIWGEAHTTRALKHVQHNNHYTSKHYHNHNQFMNNNRLTSNSETSNNSARHSVSNLNTSVDDLSDQSIIRDGQKATYAEGESETPYTHLGNQGGVDQPVIEQHIINRSMACRPFFFYSRQPNQQSLQQSHISNSRRPYTAQLMGLLSKNQDQHQLALSKLNNSSISGRSSARDTVVTAPSFLDGIPSHIKKSDAAIAASVNINKQDASPFFSKQVSSPFQLINSLSLLANSVVDHMSGNKLETLPTSLPHRNNQRLQPGAQLYSSTGISNSLSEKVEKMVEEKVRTISRADDRNKLDIDVIKNELMTNLRPERVVTEEMIRLLLKKLHKIMREERFRMGLLS